MSLAEGVAARVCYKFYSSAAIVPGIAAVSATDPAAGSAQILRRVSSSLALSKDTYQSAEIRSDRQIGDFRHGVKRVAGNISGELSPLTYEQLFEASMRGTWAAAIASDETDLTSVAADNATSKLTFGGGNPVTEGYRVGMGVRFTGLSEADNNGVTFIILAMGGTSNREWTVFPAPADMTADSEFEITSVGRSLIIPSASHVKRKVAVEIWNEDVDIARLFTEMRVGGFNVQLPASGMSTVDFEFMGRDMETYAAGDAPFFTTPSAASTTGIIAAVNGLLRVSGETVAVITGLNIQHQMELSGDPVVGSNLLPEIFTGRSVVSGQMTAMFNNVDLINDFKNESEIEILAYLTTTSAPNSPAMTFFLPRVKLGGADLQTQGEGGQMITLPFQALKYEQAATVAGIEPTTLQIWDTEVTA
ncbi:MAG: phage tail tube protein [Pseudolabrys sp.]|nr:phage tail tube protein [Pseudolabrys sp.]